MSHFVVTSRRTLVYCPPMYYTRRLRENLNLKLAADSCGYWTASCREEDTVLYNVKLKTQ